MTDPIFILATLCALVALSEWLVQHTFLRHLGTALLVIALTAIVANLGLIPAGSTPERPVAVYDGIFSYIAPAAIFLLLLQVNLRDVLKAGRPMIILFVLGAIGTAAGVVLGMFILDGGARFEEHAVALGGMLVGTYTGGGINFNALAIHYGLVTEGVLFGGAVAVDNIMTAIWMMATLSLPRLLKSLWRSPAPSSATRLGRESHVDVRTGTETVTPFGLGVLTALTFFVLWLSGVLTDLLADAGMRVPSIILVSIFALIGAQIPAIHHLKGSQLLGSFTVTLFLAVIGAFCDIAAMQSLGQVGLSLFLLICIVILVHGLIVYGGAWLFRIELDVASVASQANIGGPPSALALAQSLKRQDLVLPAVLVGSLGYAIGTFWGIFIAEYLLRAIL